MGWGWGAKEANTGTGLGGGGSNVMYPHPHSIPVLEGWSARKWKWSQVALPCSIPPSEEEEQSAVKSSGFPSLYPSTWQNDVPLYWRNIPPTIKGATWQGADRCWRTGKGRGRQTGVFPQVCPSTGMPLSLGLDFPDFNNPVLFLIFGSRDGL